MTLWLVPLLLFFAACGEDGDNNDTILTGFSGVLIFGIAAYVIFRYINRRRNP